MREAQIIDSIGAVTTLGTSGSNSLDLSDLGFFTCERETLKPDSEGFWKTEFGCL